MEGPPIRLQPLEIAAVKRIVAEHFGADAEVRVFGSHPHPQPAVAPVPR